MRFSSALCRPWSSSRLLSLHPLKQFVLHPRCVISCRSSICRSPRRYGCSAPIREPIGEQRCGASEHPLCTRCTPACKAPSSRSISTSPHFHPHLRVPAAAFSLHVCLSSQANVIINFDLPQKRDGYVRRIAGLAGIPYQARKSPASAAALLPRSCSTAHNG